MSALNPSFISRTERTASDDRKKNFPSIKKRSQKHNQIDILSGNELMRIKNSEMGFLCGLKENMKF